MVFKVDKEKAFILEDMELSNISPGRKELTIREMFKLLKNLELKVGSLEKRIIQLEKPIRAVKTKS